MMLYYTLSIHFAQFQDYIWHFLSSLNNSEMFTKAGHEAVALNETHHMEQDSRRLKGM
jgi:hypothetical protein